MSVLGIVEVGTAAAQAAIDAGAGTGSDPDAVVLRVAVLKLFKAHADNIVDEVGGDPLFDSYRAWLDIASTVYGGGEVDLREYAHRAATLTAEMEVARAVAAATVPTPSGNGAA